MMIPRTLEGIDPMEEDAAVLRAVLNTAVDAIVTIDMHGKIRHANPAIEKLFGYTNQELVGKNVSVLMPSPDRQQHDQYLRNYLATGHGKIIGIGREVLGQHKNGNQFPVDLAVSEIEVSGQRMFTGILRDMTDRRRTEEALRRERDFTESLVDTANAVVLILDHEGRIVRFNAFLEKLCGYRVDEVAGMDWVEVFVPPAEHQRAREIFAQTLSDITGQSQLVPLLTRAGQRRMLTWASRALNYGSTGSSGVLAVGNDITDLHQAEQRLIDKERLAAIGQMVAGLAHESRNALQRSRACLDMLELDCSAIPDQLDLVRRTQQALEELQRLYEEVRSYAAPIVLEKTHCSIPELCRETWNHLAAEYQSHNVELKLQCQTCGHVSSTCYCDRQRIGQVLRNIFENSLHVVPRGSTITVACQQVPYRKGQGVRISCRDEGPGLSPEQSARIFEPFFTTKTKGTGLGMAISRRIVESHGGEIFVGSDNRSGAEIVLILPL